MKELAAWKRDDAPGDVQRAVEVCERGFGIRFTSLVHFSADYLHALHEPLRTGEASLPDLVVASARDSGILDEISRLTSVANDLLATEECRRGYLQALQTVYKNLPRTPGGTLSQPDTLVVAPEREGRLLAESLGWLPEPSWHPHAKRVLFQGGLTVGIETEPLRRAARVVLVDGAIASGATIVALLAMLLPEVRELAVFSVHSTGEGIRAISRFAAMHGIQMALTVGHVTEGLNKKYYAVEGSEGTLVVGDLGDTISDLLRR